MESSEKLRRGQEAEPRGCYKEENIPSCSVVSRQSKAKLELSESELSLVRAGVFPGGLLWRDCQQGSTPASAEVCELILCSFGLLSRSIAC